MNTHFPFHKSSHLPNHLHPQNLALLPLAAHRVAQETPTEMNYIRNIKEENCSKTYYIAHEKATITAFAKLGEYLATVAKDDTMALWKNGNLQWKVNLDTQMGSRATLHMMDGKIVLGSSVNEPDAYEYINVIKIYGFDKEEKSCANKPALILSRICPISKSIFSVYQEYVDIEKNYNTLDSIRIGEWSLKGKQISTISSTLTSRKLTGSERHLVHFNDKTIMIYYRHDKKSKYLDLPLEFTDSKISHMHIEGSYLICGLWNQKNHIECYIIDLENGKISDQYLSGEKNSDEEENGKAAFNFSKVQQMAGDQNHVFMGRSNQIVAINFHNKTHISLGEHKAPITLIAMKGDLLITGSDNTEDQPAELKIWHPATMSLLSTKELPSLQMLDVSNKITGAVGSVIIEWDYQVDHKGIMTHINTKPPLRKIAP